MARTPAELDADFARAESILARRGIASPYLVDSIQAVPVDVALLHRFQARAVCHGAPGPTDLVGLFNEREINTILLRCGLPFTDSSVFWTTARTAETYAYEAQKVAQYKKARYAYRADMPCTISLGAYEALLDRVAALEDRATPTVAQKGAVIKY